MAKEVMDAKTMLGVLHLIGNIVATSRFLCQQTLAKTTIFNLFERVSHEHNTVHPDIIEQVTWVNKLLTKFAYELVLDENCRHFSITIAHLGLQKDYKQTTLNSVKALKHLAEHFEEEISKIATVDTITRLVNLVNAADFDHCLEAIICLSCIFASEDSEPIQKAINSGFFSII